MKTSILLSLFCIVVFCAGCGKTSVRSAGETKKVTKVETVKPQTRDFRNTVRIQGTVIPVEEADISSRTDGNLDALLVREGSSVKKGTILFRVDQKNLENKVAIAEKELVVARNSAETAEADLDIMKTKRDKALLDYKRAERLIESKVISADAYETSQMNFKNAEVETKKYESLLNYSRAKVQQQEIQLEIARKNLEDSQVRAPFDGIVTEKFKEQGEYVGSGTAIVHMENPSRFEIRCMISAVYHPRVAENKTKGRILFDQYELCTATVCYRADNIDPLSRTFELKFALPPSLEIISGTLCNIDMILEERRGPGIPSDAVLLRKGGEYQAYVVRGGKAEAVAVTPGITSGGYTELLHADNLKDELFVVSGQYFLNTGDPVEVLSTKAPASEER